MDDRKAMECQGKASYLTRDAAMRTARSVKRSKGRACGAYRCRFCSGWHIGTVGRR